jgi:putative ABC transport system substrate-binding protein
MLGLLKPVALAQPRSSQKVHRIGFLIVGSPSASDEYAAGYAAEVERLGLQEGVNLITELRAAHGDMSRLEPLAAELVGLKPDVIVVGGTRAALVLQKATKTIPIVFTAADPVSRGLVESLARPGGNLTGNAVLELDVKRAEILAEAAGSRATIAIVGGVPRPERLRQEWLSEIAAASMRRPEQMPLVEMPDAKSIAPAFEALVRLRANAAIFVSSPLLFHQQEQIAALAAKHRLAAIAEGREFALGGGLLSYSTDWADVGRRAARYVHKILSGALPADLPVEQTSRFKLIVNSKTAKSLGLEIPRSILLRADEVVE